MDLSVVIISYNVRDYLANCLRSLPKDSDGIKHEIFVVDNYSSDDTCEMIRREFPYVTLLVNKTNRGFAAACNQALQKMSGRYALLLNPDTLLEKDTLRNCISFMDANPQAGAAGVRMVDGDGRYLRESKRRFPSASASFFKTTGLASIFPGKRIFNGYYHPDTESSEPYEVEVLAGAFMLIRSSVLKKTGFLDEDYFMYGEDIDLSYRIVKAGFGNYYIPSACIIHFKGKSTSRTGYDDIRHFYSAMRIYIRKRSEDGDYRHLKHLLIAAVHVREAAALARRFAGIAAKQMLQSIVT